jgi:glutathione peroxidase
MAFPCDNFFNQEPGTNADVLEFVQSIGVEFVVMGKLECENGAKTHPLYQYLRQSVGGGILGRQLKWNYTKFLVNADGVPVKRSGPTDTPLSMEKDILALLQK